jgi:hypothetical protein
VRAASALQQHFSGTTVDAARASSQPNRLIGRVGNITGSKNKVRVATTACRSSKQVCSEEVLGSAARPPSRR